MSAFSFYSLGAPPNRQTFESIGALIMPVIAGLDLHDIQWSKFRPSYTWSRDYHLRRTKFLVYLLAIACCFTSASVGAATIDGYVRQKCFLEQIEPGASVDVGEYIHVASFNIFACAYVVFIFVSAFLLDLFFPERRESRAVRRTWKTVAVLGALQLLGEAIALTIIVSSRVGQISNVPDTIVAGLLSRSSGETSLLYRENACAVASVVLLWAGWLATESSVIVMFACHRHDDRFGPWSKRGLERLRAERMDRSAGLAASDVSEEELGKEKA